MKERIIHTLLEYIYENKQQQHIKEEYSLIEKVNLFVIYLVMPFQHSNVIQIKFLSIFSLSLQKWMFYVLFSEFSILLFKIQIKQIHNHMYIHKMLPIFPFNHFSTKI